MNTQDRAVVKALLQYMTTKRLTGSDEFRAALKHFNVTTTWQEGYRFSGEEHFVDVFSPDTIDLKVNGVRHTFATIGEATAFAETARATGDMLTTAEIDALHAEALAEDAARAGFVI